MSDDPTTTRSERAQRARSTNDPPTTARRPTMRELVDRELRTATLSMVADLPARPHEQFDDVARGKANPWRYWARTWERAARAGVSREHLKHTGVVGFIGAIDVICDAVEAESQPPRAA